MHSSIRTRLSVAFIALAIGPLILVGVILAWQSFTTQQQQALNLQREVARRISSQIIGFFAQVEDELYLISQVQGLCTVNRDRQYSVLSELLTYQDIFEELALLDNQGQEQIHLSRYSVITTLRDRSQAAEFVGPQTTGQTYYGPVRFAEATGEPLMTISVPLFNVRSGQIAGVLVSDVRIKKIWALIAETKVDSGQSAYVINAQGQVVAHRNPSVVLRGANLRVLRPAGGIQPGLNGTRVVLAIEKVRVGDQEFNVVAEQAVSEALAPGINAVRIIVILVMIMLIISATLGFITVRQIVQPIQAMAAVAQAISAGDLYRQVEVTGQDELGKLGVAFNHMTTRLRESLESLEQHIAQVRQTQESLRKSETRYRTLVESQVDLVSRYLPDTTLTFVNDAYCKFFGKAREELIGQSYMFMIAPEYRELVRQETEELARNPRPLSGEYVNYRWDGAARWIQWIVSCIVDESDQVVELQAVGRDITEIKQAEAERESLIAELEARNAELERFLYTVSHDLRSPLITLGGFVGFLQKDAVEGNVERLETDAAYINDALTRMRQLLDELLKFSRIGRLTNPSEVVPFEAIAREAVALEQHAIEARGVKVVILPDLPTVSGDRARLVEVVQNLVDNACKFMGEQPHPQIEIGARQTEDKTVFYVRDNGIGIDPRYHNQVFGLFDKLDPTSEGIGIGLALVKRIVEVHGGSIWIESELGAGATFCFTLAQKG